MKTLFTLLVLLLMTSLLSAQQTQYQQLVSVNKQWQYQKDIDPSLKSTKALVLTEQQLVQFHLQQVEKLLRSSAISNLSKDQQEHRAEMLNILHGYQAAGIFPKNNQHQNRQPYFIDDFGTFCAVGYLMKQTGQEAMARVISKNQNYYYLADISHPGLMDWVSTTGLSINELALIQPGYGGEYPAFISEIHYNNVGKDTLEYLELEGSTGGLIGYYNFDSIFLYNKNGVKYKTLTNNQPYGLVYYQFNNGDTLADEGKIVLINRKQSGSPGSVIGEFIYNADSIVTISRYNNGSIINTYTYYVTENNNTPIGKSLNFCGSPFTRYASILTETIGTKNPCVLVPVALGSFEYTITEGGIELSWQTYNETNNHHFEIERSVDGKSFTSIGTVAAGKNKESNNYYFKDTKPEYINQYRLKQIDKDGTYSYSKILFVKYTKANPLSILSNPVINNIKVNISLDNISNCNLFLFDLYGKQLKSIKAKQGTQSISVDGIAAGNYWLVLSTTAGATYSQPIMIAR